MKDILCLETRGDDLEAGEESKKDKDLSIFLLSKIVLKHFRTIDYQATIMLSWIHCNMCMNITSLQLGLSSCGKVICSTCKPMPATSSSAKNPASGQSLSLTRLPRKFSTSSLTSLKSEGCVHEVQLPGGAQQIKNMGMEEEQRILVRRMFGGEEQAQGLFGVGIQPKHGVFGD
jgi:hypothetical protein